MLRRGRVAGGDRQDSKAQEKPPPISPHGTSMPLTTQICGAATVGLPRNLRWGQIADSREGALV
jgi:hypothetical protein